LPGPLAATGGPIVWARFQNCRGTAIR
jgi:hypothetical protein